jgi:tetratricopeptide (TPR) repeat protein
MSSQPRRCPSCLKIMPLARRKCPYCLREYPLNDETQSLEILFLQDALVGKFEILSELHRRGSSTLFLAQDLILDRKVAVKTIKFKKNTSKDVLEKWNQNIKRCLRLEEPHLARMYSFGMTGSLHYIILEYVPSDTLEDAVTGEQTALPIWKSLRIGRDIAQGLHAAHNRGITHHRLKPSNIAVTRNGFSRILDLGASQGTIDALEKHPWSSATDTSHYFAPEQIETGHSDAQSDQYRLSACLYYALSGTPPFKDPGETGAFQRLHGDPKPLTARNPLIPKELNTIIFKALSRNPDERFCDCLEFSRQLESLDPDLWLPEIEPIFKGPTRQTTVALILAELQRTEQNRDYDRALVLCEQALALAPYNSDVTAALVRIQKLHDKDQLLHSIVNKALVAFYSDNLSDALTILKSGRQLDKDHPEILRLTHEVMQEQERKRLSNVLLDAAKIDLAKQALSAAMANVVRVLDLDPKNETALKLRRRIEFEMEDRAALGILLSRAETAFENAQFDDAEELIIKIKRIDPENITAEKLKSKIDQQKRRNILMTLWENMDNEFQNGHYRQAISILKRIADIEPGLVGDIRNRLIQMRQKLREQETGTAVSDTQPIRAVRESDLVTASTPAIDNTISSTGKPPRETPGEPVGEYLSDSDPVVLDSIPAVSQPKDNNHETRLRQMHPFSESLSPESSKPLMFKRQQGFYWLLGVIAFFSIAAVFSLFFRKSTPAVQNADNPPLQIQDISYSFSESTPETTARDQPDVSSPVVSFTNPPISGNLDVEPTPLEPEVPPVILSLLASGRENERRGNMDFAAILYKEVLKTFPKNTEALKGLERCERLRGQP